MSFTSLVKNEITQIEQDKAERIALLSAYFNIAGHLDNNKINITTENAAVARSIFKLIKNLYNITPLVKIKNQAYFHKQHLYTIEIYDPNGYITSDLSLIIDQKRMYIPSEYIVSDEESVRAYLAGLFLARGSVNDPKTARYHLEIIFDHSEQVKFAQKLANNFHLNSKIIIRNDHFVLYIKEAEKISDFLRIISAYNAVMYFEDIRIYRDHKNMTNRLNNCEQANIDKIISASESLINDMNIIIECGHYDLLPSKLKTTIDYKLKYPETSLQELSLIMEKETGEAISKSGLNHRMRQIREISEKLKK